MKDTVVAPTSISEPVGIIISRGSRAEPAPLVRAYVYGAPDTEPDTAPRAA
jgi:hypothetical protein